MLTAVVGVLVMLFGLCWVLFGVYLSGLFRPGGLVAAVVFVGLGIGPAFFLLTVGGTMLQAGLLQVLAVK